VQRAMVSPLLCSSLKANKYLWRLSKPLRTTDYADAICADSLQEVSIFIEV